MELHRSSPTRINVLLHDPTEAQARAVLKVHVFHISTFPIQHFASQDQIFAELQYVRGRQYKAFLTVLLYPLLIR